MTMKLRDLIRAVRACKTAADERAIIAKESALIRTAFKEEQNEFRHRNVAKLLYIHMLGYPTHFGQMESIKLIASQKYSEKRIGYLALMLLLDEKQEVLTLVTNSLQVDLNSSTTSPYAVGLALAAIGNIGSNEIARDLANDVEKLLKSNNSYIRKKAALACIRMIRKVPDLIEAFLPSIISLLLDKNHNVLLTGVTLISTVMEVAPDYTSKFTKLVPALIKILRKLITAGYAPEYDVGGVTDPFLQTRILALLRVLGKGNTTISESMNNILAQVASTIDSGHNSGNAVLYECVNTIMTVDSEPGLRVLAVNILGKFLSGKDNNIKYVALQTLCKVVHIDAPAVQRHRTIIVDCLKDGDVSIRRRALELVYALVNVDNVRLLTKEMLNYLAVADPESKPDLCVKIAAVAAKYAPSARWHIDTLITMLSIAGDSTKSQISAAALFYIARATPTDHAAVVHKLFAMASAAVLSSAEAQQQLLQVAVWCIGEYGHLLLQPPPSVPRKVGSPNSNTTTNDDTNNDLTGPFGETRTDNDIIKLLDKIIHLYYANTDTKGMTLTALLKLFYRLKDTTSYNRIRTILHSFGISSDIELQQRSIEFTTITDSNRTPTLNDSQRRALVEPIPLLEESVLRARAAVTSGDAKDAAENLGGEEHAMTIVERTHPKVQADEHSNIGASNKSNVTGGTTSLLDSLDDLFSTVTNTADVTMKPAAPVNDIFGFDGLSMGSNTNTNTNTTSSITNKTTMAAPTNDLLGDLFSTPVTTNTNTKPINTMMNNNNTMGMKAPVNNGIDLGSLFSGLPTTTNTTTMNSTASSLLDDPFSMSSSSSSTANATVTRATLPTVSNSNVDIFGMPLNNTVTPTKPVAVIPPTLPTSNNTNVNLLSPNLFASPVTSTASTTKSMDIFDAPLSSSASSGPSTSTPFVAYESTNNSGIRVTLRCEKVGGNNSNPNTDITVTYTCSNSSINITNFVCQMAVPKYMKLTMQPASGDILSSSTTITQSLRIENTQQGSKPLALRLKLVYNISGNPEQIVEQTDVRNFPAGL